MLFVTCKCTTYPYHLQLSTVYKHTTAHKLAPNEFLPAQRSRYASGPVSIQTLKIQEARTRVHSSVQFLTAYFLCFLQAVSYLYFVSRLPNHHQQLDKLFYFLLVQVSLPEVSHRRHYGRFSTLFSNAAVWSAPLPSWNEFFCLNRFSRFKCHSVEEVQGYNMKLERKVTANRFQRYTRSKLSNFSNMFCMFCVYDRVYVYYS